MSQTEQVLKKKNILVKRNYKPTTGIFLGGYICTVHTDKDKLNHYPFRPHMNRILIGIPTDVSPVVPSGTSLFCTYHWRKINQDYYLLALILALVT